MVQQQCVVNKKSTFLNIPPPLLNTPQISTNMHIATQTKCICPYCLQKLICQQQQKRECKKNKKCSLCAVHLKSQNLVAKKTSLINKKNVQKKKTCSLIVV
eukprot:GEMP01088737.1.p2 GENE.GEMP01088737.1~~GEMP01088737.1.p2  ORF type:complete len:101 (-),score=1.92 GEMP01088737.1:60-362(-)